MVLYFRTDQTGDAVFGINEWGGVSHIQWWSGFLLGALAPAWWAVIDLKVPLDVAYMLGSVLAGDPA